MPRTVAVTEDTKWSLQICQDNNVRYYLIYYTDSNVQWIQHGQRIKFQQINHLTKTSCVEFNGSS